MSFPPVSEVANALTQFSTERFNPEFAVNSQQRIGRSAQRFAQGWERPNIGQRLAVLPLGNSLRTNEQVAPQLFLCESLMLPSLLYPLSKLYWVDHCALLCFGYVQHPSIKRWLLLSAQLK